MGFLNKTAVLLVLAVTTLVLVNGQQSKDIELNEIFDNIKDVSTAEDESNDEQPHEFILSWQARRSLNRILSHMACGWPEYEIPPMAPYIRQDLVLQTTGNFSNFHNRFEALRIDGLNKMEINKLSVGYFTKLIYFDVNFPNITISGKFDLSTYVNLAKVMGIKFSLRGNGNLEMSLENLRLFGSFHYKLPLLFGSSHIFNMNLDMHLGNVHSQTTGSLNSKRITPALNEYLETNLRTMFNDYENIFSVLLQQFVVPRVNMQLEGTKLWNLLLWSLEVNDKPCSAQKEN